MQPTRFDAITRALAQTRTRRGAFRLAGGALALLGSIPRHHTAGAAKAGSQKDLADICRQAGGIQAPGLDGSFNCVLDDGWEIHCDPSGRCKSHCWQRYGCNCAHADVCHREAKLGVYPGGTVALPHNALALVSTGDGSEPVSGVDDPVSTGRKRRRRRKRNRRRK